MIGVSWLVALALPAVPLPIRLPAEVDDLYALRFNPAGLGYVRGTELRLLYGREAGANGFAAYGGVHLIDGLVLGAGFSVDSDGDRTGHDEVIGLAWGGQLGAIGLTWEHIAPLEGDDKGILSAGASYRIARWIAVGAAVRDVAQHFQRREWDFGIAIRPFTERVLVSTRWRLTQSEPLNGDTLDLTFLAQAEPFDGLTVGAAINLDLDLVFTLGLRLDNFGVGSAVFVDDDRDVSIAGEVVYHSVRKPSLIAPARVALVTIDGELVPDPQINLLSQTLDVTPYGGAPLYFDNLARSDRIDGVFLRVGPLEVGWAKAMEMRTGIQAVQKAGRRVDCYLTGSSDVSYYVASACTTIAIAPAMNLNVNGVAAEVLYFADGLRELGIQVEVVRREAYKSSPDQFTRSGMSAEQRESLGAYLDAVFDVLVSGIAEGRKLPDAEVQALIDMGTLTATEAVSKKLVDAVLYPDELDAYVEKLYGESVSFIQGQDAYEPERPRWHGPDKIAVVHVDAAIASGDSVDLPFGLGNTVGARTVVQALEEIRADDSIVAMVLRVDSPGGDSFASDLIARAVRRVQETKPVVASFGDVAASGGYYIAADAGTIYAEPATLTGSIGVFAMTVTAEELLSKLGIHASTVERGTLSNSGSFAHSMTETERAALDKTVDDAYRLFLEVVARGRDMKKEDVRALAQGRIWSGRDAKAKGLVDELGGLLDAVRRAKTSAGIDVDREVELVTYPNNRRPLPGLVSLISGAFTPAVTPGLEVIFPHGVRRALARVAAQSIDSSVRPQALIPFVLEVD
jgi:protease IV